MIVGRSQSCRGVLRAAQYPQKAGTRSKSAKGLIDKAFFDSVSHASPLLSPSEASPKRPARKRRDFALPYKGFPRGELLRPYWPEPH